TARCGREERAAAHSRAAGETGVGRLGGEGWSRRKALGCRGAVAVYSCLPAGHRVKGGATAEVKQWGLGVFATV
ncbi:hypothetical protein, partial [Salmonella enterica]|uniref:hypothetical protein n=1 Tax=Salmonella enterica TaxID=28901 RepID=UPI00398C72D2